MQLMYFNEGRGRALYLIESASSFFETMGGVIRRPAASFVLRQWVNDFSQNG